MAASAAPIRQPALASSIGRLPARLVAVHGAVEREQQAPGVPKEDHGQQHGDRQAGRQCRLVRALEAEHDQGVGRQRDDHGHAVVDVDGAEIEARLAGERQAAAGAGRMHAKPAGEQAAAAAVRARERQGPPQSLGT
jgi:hypothetical protein